MLAAVSSSVPTPVFVRPLARVPLPAVFCAFWRTALIARSAAVLAVASATVIVKAPAALVGPMLMALKEPVPRLIEDAAEPPAVSVPLKAKAGKLALAPPFRSTWPPLSVGLTIVLNELLLASVPPAATVIGAEAVRLWLPQMSNRSRRSVPPLLIATAVVALRAPPVPIASVPPSMVVAPV